MGCIARDPPVHRLSGCAGEVLKGSFMSQNYVIIDKNKVFKIEKNFEKKKTRV